MERAHVYVLWKLYKEGRWRTCCAAMTGCHVVLYCNLFVHVCVIGTFGEYIYMYMPD